MHFSQGLRTGLYYCFAHFFCDYITYVDLGNDAILLFNNNPLNNFGLTGVILVQVISVNLEFLSMFVISV